MAKVEKMTQVTKTKRPMKLSLLGLVFVSFSFLSACEDFVRFRTEKYTCDINRLGLQSIELETQRGTTIAMLFTEQGPQALEIVLREKDQLELKVEDNEIRVNRETGEIEALLGARFATLTCTKSVFSM